MTGRVLASERIVLGISALTLSIALTSWVLMRFGAFTLGRATAISLVVAAALWLAARRASLTLPAPREPWHWVALAGLVCLGFGALYAAYPTYFMLGGQDPGPYLAFGARIARTGGLDLRVPEIQQWAKEHGPGLFRSYPAVYGDLGSPEPNAVRPQFVHLYTAYLANWWAAGGIEGAVRANAWIAVLSLATGFALVRRLGALTAAFAFVLALGLSPAFVWASRITMTEVVALWLNLLGLLLLVLAWEAESFVLGVFGAGVLGLGVLNRLDGGLGAFALLGFSAVTTLEGGRRSRIAVAAAVVHLVLIGFGYFDGERLAPDYFHDLNRVSGGTVYKLIAVTLALDLLAVALALAPGRLKPRAYVNETTLRMAGYAGAVLMAVWVAYGLTLRPFERDPESATIFFELTWYVGAIAWPLAMIGFGAALGASRYERSLPLLAYTAGALFIYTSRTDVAHEHIWASRRWVPQVIPFVIAGAALGIPHALSAVARLAARAGSIASRAAVALSALAVAAAWSVPFLVFSEPFLFRSMLQGLPASYERVAEYARKHQDKWPLVTATVQLGSILTYAYGVPTLVLNARGAEQAEQGKLVGELGIGFDAFDLRNSLGIEAYFTGKYLERTENVPPKRLVNLRVPLEGGVFGPSDFDMQIAVSHPSFRTNETIEQPDGSLLTTGEKAKVLWGPWLDLAPGRYRVECWGSIGHGRRKRRGTLDVIYDKGHETIARAPIEVVPGQSGERALAGVDFELTELTKGIEFRVSVEEESGIRLARIRLQRLGAVTAP